MQVVPSINYHVQAMVLSVNFWWVDWSFCPLLGFDRTFCQLPEILQQFVHFQCINKTFLQCINKTFLQLLVRRQHLLSTSKALTELSVNLRCLYGTFVQFQCGAPLSVSYWCINRNFCLLVGVDGTFHQLLAHPRHFRAFPVHQRDLLANFGETEVPSVHF